jgi:hypothetical protein
MNSHSVWCSLDSRLIKSLARPFAQYGCEHSALEGGSAAQCSIESGLNLHYPGKYCNFQGDTSNIAVNIGQLMNTAAAVHCHHVKVQEG